MFIACFFGHNVKSNIITKQVPAKKLTIVALAGRDEGEEVIETGIVDIAFVDRTFVAIALVVVACELLVVVWTALVVVAVDKTAVLVAGVVVVTQAVPFPGNN